MAPTLYRLLLLLKLGAVLAYAAGAGASLLSTSLEARKRAVHGVASPALVVIWICGYALSQLLGVSLSEPWLLGGMVLSVVSLLALVFSAQRGARPWAAVAVGALLATLALMVLRPGYGSVAR